MKEIIKIFECIVVYFIPILSISIQLFSELKAKKVRKKLLPNWRKMKLILQLKKTMVKL